MYVKKQQLQSKEEEFIKSMLLSQSKESVTLGLTLLLHLCKDDGIVDIMITEFMSHYSLWDTIKNTREQERIILFSLSDLPF